MKIVNSTLASDGTPWRLFAPVGATKEWCVLWLQGFSSTIERHNDGVIRMAEASKTAFAMLNYAGHGNHPTPLNDATHAQQLAEVVGVYDALKELGYKKIIVVGTSFGGYMAALLAAQRPFEVLVLRAAANYFDDEFNLAYSKTAEIRNHKKPLYRQAISGTFTNRAIEGVRNFKGCTYVVEHEADEVINPSILKSYFNAAHSGGYVVIPGLQHSPRTMANPEQYFGLIEFWVATIVEVSRRNASLRYS